MQTNNKLREALEMIVRSAIASDEELCSEYGAYTDPWGYIADMKDTARLALAEPVKNCEVGSPKEQNERHNKFCYAHRSYDKGCGGCPLNGEPCCELAWAQMPYEEGGDK